MRDHHETRETEERLVELLERAGERIPVAAAPVSAIRGRARVRRQGGGGGVSRGRRPWAPALAVAASIAVIIGGVAVVADQQQTLPPGPVLGPVAVSSVAEQPPPGTRWRGVAPVAVAVPDGWSRAPGEAAGCEAGELTDTFTLRPRYRETLGNCDGVDYRGPGVETVYVGPATSAQFSGRQRQEVSLGADVTAERSQVTCGQWSYQGRDDIELCRGAITLPGLDLIVNVTSTTSAAEVDRLLDTVRIFGDAASVPPPPVAPDRPRARLEAYEARVREAGLQPEVRRTVSPAPAGSLLGADPGVGAVLPRASTVLVEVSAGPDGVVGELDVPRGMQLLGVGPVAVPVPSAWVRRSRTDAECGTDVAYVVSETEAALPPDDRGCGVPPAGVDRVTVGPPGAEGGPAGGTVICFGDAPSQCGATVPFERLGLVVSVNSSTDEETVGRILDRVRVLTDHVGVPSPVGLDAQAYADLLRSYGLEPELRALPADDVAPGVILPLPDRVRLEVVSPGTVVPRGTTVQVPYAAG